MEISEISEMEEGICSMEPEGITPSAVAAVVERRAMLKALGPRPDHEVVQDAHQAVAKIEAQMAEKMESIYDDRAPDGIDMTKWREIQSVQEREIREAAENEKLPYKSIIELDELHQSYEELLRGEERALDGWGQSEITESKEDEDDANHAEAALRLRDAFNGRHAVLNLSKSSLSYIPESFGQIVTLVNLDLSSNQLKMLPDSVAGLVNLETLNISSNQLRNLPDSIGLLMKLKYLDVSSNMLTSLPESLGRCISLEELNACFNELEFIFSSFGFLLSSLQKLDLHLNKLGSLPHSICELKSLRYLDLHMNKLKVLPSSIGNLSRLEYLDMSSNFNDLLALPESIGDLVCLTYFDLSFNQIRELPDSVGRLDKLRTLKLEGNPCVVPPMEVVEQSHEAVMAYMRQRWKTSIEADENVSASDSPLAAAALNEWVPAWAGNSRLGAWIGTLWGTGVGSKSGNLFGFQERQKDEYLDQQL